LFKLKQFISAVQSLYIMDKMK